MDPHLSLYLPWTVLHQLLCVLNTTVSSLFKSSQQPKIYGQVPGILCTGSNTCSILERKTYRDGVFMFFYQSVKGWKKKQKEDADARHSGLPLALRVQLFQLTVDTELFRLLLRCTKLMCLFQRHSSRQKNRVLNETTVYTKHENPHDKAFRFATKTDYINVKITSSYLDGLSVVSTYETASISWRE